MVKFHKFAATSQGIKYLDKGWACQDSSGTLEFENIQVIAVADGHGGSDYFRSEYGSQIAIQTLFEQVKIFCNDLKKSERFSDNGIKNFKYDLVQEWRKAVKKDWQERLSGGVLGEGEIRYKSVSDKYKARYTSDNPKIVENYLYTAYGTTLVCAISIGTQILILQIGDGSCVVLLKNGELISPVPKDPENFLNVTTSMCDDKSELKIRHAVLECGNFSINSPVAIFLSTDGLDDCFPYYKNEEHLYKFYSGVVIENMLEFGYDSTEDEIQDQLLVGLTKRSSHDDISLAYLVPEDIEILRKVYNQIDNNHKSLEKSTEKVSDDKTTDVKIENIEEITSDEDRETIVTMSIIKDANDDSEEKESIETPPIFPNTTGAKILKANEISISETPVIIPSSIKKD